MVGPRSENESIFRWPGYISGSFLDSRFLGELTLAYPLITGVWNLFAYWDTKDESLSIGRSGVEASPLYSLHQYCLTRLI